MTTDSNTVPPLNTLNYLNLLGCILNTGATQAIALGVFGSLPDNAELSRKYQTIFTPAGWAFAIWAIIFISQLVFAIVQLFPPFRDNAMVRKGVGYYYFSACVFQTVWGFVFALEKLWLSFFVMLGILVSLVLLVSSQYMVETERSTMEYILLRFPFEVHCGWIIAASALNFNVVLVGMSASANFQLVSATMSLIALLVVAVGVLFRPRPPLYVIAFVFAWAAFGIWSELGSPDSSITERFSEKAIERFRMGAGAVSAFAIILSIVRVARKEKGEQDGLVDMNRQTNNTMS